MSFIMLRRRECIQLQGSEDLSPRVLSIIDNYYLNKDTYNEPVQTSNYQALIISVLIPKTVSNITFSMGSTGSWRLFSYNQGNIIKNGYPINSSMPRTYALDSPADRIDMSVLKLNKNNAYILDADTGEAILRCSDLEELKVMVIDRFYMSYTGKLTSGGAYCTVIVDLSESVNNLSFSTGSTAANPGLAGFNDSTPHNNTFIVGVAGKYDTTGSFIGSNKLALAVHKENKNDAYIYDEDRGKYIWKGSEMDWSKYGLS